MTEFGCRVSFDDNEMRTLQRALSHYLELCQREIKKGEDVPFTSHMRIIKSFRTKVGKQLKQTQGFTLAECEIYVVQGALQRYSDACEREIANGTTRPFAVDRATVKKIRATLKDEFERAVINTSLIWAARKQL